MVLSASLLLSGCARPKSELVAAEPPPPPLPRAELAITPAGEGLPISAQVELAVTNGTVKAVTLTDDKGAQVAGSMLGLSWVPDQPLAFSTHYTATAVATGQDGQDVTQTTGFTTMARPANRVGTGLYLFDDLEYGVAMPVVVEFTSDVEPEARAGVERRLFVTTEPVQEGVWSWSSPRQVQYRAADYWLPGTRITVRAGLDGHPLGAGKYGDSDRRAAARIAATKVELFIDNATKHLTVRQDGTDLRSMPVSLGKPSTPSSSGTMVIMDKKTQTVFDTTGEPGDQYRADISYAQRLTWGGEFIHAAPWSVGDQGYNNVSHGCVNMSWGDAEWLFGITHVGDPVTVIGTEVMLESGNGFTAWNKSWQEHVSGSALPGR